MRRNWVAHLMDCTAKFSAYIARVFAENASAPLMFMGRGHRLRHRADFQSEMVAGKCTCEMAMDCGTNKGERL